MYDLVVKDGLVIDPGQGIRGHKDIGISNGKIAALADAIVAGEAKRIIDAKGLIVTPGLIDLHAHVAGGIVDLGIPPDEGSVLSGVTTVCDAGSTGYANFAGFRKFVIPQARGDVFCFLHMCSAGFILLHEVWTWENIDTGSMLKVIEKNRDIIKGIKMRAVGPVIRNLGVEAMRVAKKVAVEAGLPLLIHIGSDPDKAASEDMTSAFTREMLSLLKAGDILSHIYTWKPGGFIKPDGSVLPDFKEAMQKGVVLDVAQGGSNWGFEIARKGLEKGILPTTVSSDVSSVTINGPVFSLPATMSRFLAVGLTLDQLVEMTTINPARVLGEEHRRGSLRVGMPADISILELSETDFTFVDGTRKTFQGNRLLIPKLTVKSGVEIKTQPHLK